MPRSISAYSTPIYIHKLAKNWLYVSAEDAVKATAASNMRTISVFLSQSHRVTRLMQNRIDTATMKESQPPRVKYSCSRDTTYKRLVTVVSKANRSEVTRNKTKDRWVLRPTHVLSAVQWWSKPATHLLHTAQ